MGVNLCRDWLMFPFFPILEQPKNAVVQPIANMVVVRWFRTISYVASAPGQDMRVLVVRILFSNAHQTIATNVDHAQWSQGNRFAIAPGLVITVNVVNLTPVWLVSTAIMGVVAPCVVTFPNVIAEGPDTTGIDAVTRFALVDIVKTVGPVV